MTNKAISPLRQRLIDDMIIATTGFLVMEAAGSPMELS
jgi:hypothetical protein